MRAAFAWFCPPSRTAFDQYEGRRDESAAAVCPAGYVCRTVRLPDGVLCPYDRRGDALLHADGSVKALVKLSLIPERRRGHGALFGG